MKLISKNLKFPLLFLAVSQNKSQICREYSMESTALGHNSHREHCERPLDLQPPTLSHCLKAQENQRRNRRSFFFVKREALWLWLWLQLLLFCFCFAYSQHAPRHKFSIYAIEEVLEGTPLTEIAMSPSPLRVLLLMQPTNHNRFVVNAKLIINPLAASSVCVRCGM